MSLRRSRVAWREALAPRLRSEDSFLHGKSKRNVGMTPSGAASPSRSTHPGTALPRWRSDWACNCGESTKAPLARPRSAKDSKESCSACHHGVLVQRNGCYGPSPGRVRQAALPSFENARNEGRSRTANLNIGWDNIDGGGDHQAKGLKNHKRFAPRDPAIEVLGGGSFWHFRLSNEPGGAEGHA